MEFRTMAVVTTLLTKQRTIGEFLLPINCCPISIPQNMNPSLIWINILTKNAMICLVWNICDLSNGHWLNTRRKTNGVAGVLEEVENEFWGYISNDGPFEPVGEDFRKWVDYVNAKKTVLMKKISNIQSRLLEVQEKMDFLRKDNNRKGPAIGVSQAEGTSFGSWSSLGHISLTLKQYLQVLRNWEAYLDEVRTGRGWGAPVKEIQSVMDRIETEKGTVDPGEVLRISLLLKNLRKSVKTREDDPSTSCNGGDTKTGGNALRQVQKNFSEAFLYKNITLAEINQMSKIVDFVEKYRGRVEKILGAEDRRNAAKPEIVHGEEEVGARRGT